MMSPRTTPMQALHQTRLHIVCQRRVMQRACSTRALPCAEHDRLSAGWMRRGSTTGSEAGTGCGSRCCAF